MEKKIILFVLGTRPEAIKIAPLYLALAAQPGFQPKILLTGQQPDMAREMLAFFGIAADHSITLERKTFTLSEFTALCLTACEDVISELRPELIVVQGDTSSAFCGALAGYYNQIKIVHLEAGLRTYDKYAPFPEEVLRRMIGTMADIHLAPTQTAREALLREGISSDAIHVTGNTVIDALLATVRKIETEAGFRDGLEADLQRQGVNVARLQNAVLITGHRRENFGDKFKAICQAIRDLAQEYTDQYFIYPVHLNPNVRGPVGEILDGIANICLTEPVSYPHFIYLMQKSRLILTDSGGIQEEAPSLGKPVLVMRDVTERPEAVAAGCARLVGTERIVAAVRELLENDAAYLAMSQVKNPYGDGHSAERIVHLLQDA